MKVNKYEYEYYGWMYGLVPIYVKDPHGECHVATRNWCPEWWFDFIGLIHELMIPWAETFPIKLTGEISCTRKS